ncbi:hypothetical protein Leryth_015544 [Lithospermum erythrorhizon]|nr:hypothetical protein Leryth_015544 [Lithospermum erythrorhizon]
MKDSDSMTLLADVLSALAFILSEENNESLKYKLVGSQDNLSHYGYEYVRNLAGEVTAEFNSELEHIADKKNILYLAQQIVVFYMKHNDEYKAVDFMLEVGCEHEYVLENLRKENYEEICLYLINRVRNLHEPDDKAALGSLYLVCLKLKDYPTALRIAFCLNSMTFVRTVFKTCDDLKISKQLCFIIARHEKPFQHL